MTIDFEITTGIENLDMKLVHQCLSQESYWAKNRSFRDVQKSFEASLCFSLRDRSKQELLGFCRVVTDYVAFAYVMDVFVIKEFRGQGLGQALIEYVLKHPDIAHVIRCLLATEDAHELYRKLGFKNLEYPENHLEKRAN